MTATFKNKNPNINCNFIECYAPETANAEVKDDIYGLLQQVTAGFSNQDTLIVSGDLNAEVWARQIKCCDHIESVKVIKKFDIFLINR